VSGERRIDRWVMFWAIPVIALAVAARQLYLSTTDDLSTWKGGGMGMFAGSEVNTRYAKVYLTFPDGRRQPLLRLTDKQEELKEQALNYPSERNLRALANSVKATTWWASTTHVPLNVFGQDGKKVQDGTKQFYDLYPAHPRTASEPAEFGVEIEYWKATYDPKSGEYAGALVRTYKSED
jgi:hypothetical protein